MRCAQRKFCGAMAEGFAPKKISSVDFCFVSKGSCGNEVFFF